MRKLSPELQRKNLVFTKLNAVERAQVAQVAQAEGITQSAVIRRAILRDLLRNLTQPTTRGQRA